MAELLAFQRSIVEQMLAEDGLCVMAPGLGLHQIVAVLLRLQDVRLQNPEQKGTAIIVGATPWQRTAIRQELARIHPPTDRAPPNGGEDLPAEITADIPTSERLRLYRTCSSAFVTTRILVVDFLSGRLEASDVAGLIVLSAHRVSDSSGEGFAVRLFRAGNASGFVRAFSDAPAAFSTDFGKVEKVLKALHVRRLHLWPRFQVAVQEDLEARPPELVEISLPLDPGAALVYEALAELIDGCIKELRKVERLDTTDLTAARGLSASLDEAVRRQLAPVWHTVSPKTRQIVADLRTLRTLASFLQKFDPITFLTYLDTLRATEGTNCAWLFHSAAHTVFEAAKRRVYQLTAPSQQAAAKRRRKEGADPSEAGTDADGAASVSVPSVEPALEELPKWHALLEVLAEARADAAKVTAATGGDGNDGQDGSAVAVATPPVVVFCQDEFTCRQLRGVVGPDGPGGFMRNLYREFLQYKIDVATGGRRGSGAATTGTNGFNGAPSSRMMGGYLPGEEAALVKEARGLGATRTAGRGQGRRGGGRGGRGRGRAAAAAAAAAAALEKAAAAAPKHDDSPATSPEKGTGSGDMVGGDGSGASPRKAPKAPSDPADVRFVALDTSGALALWTYDPSHVVVYDPDVALTRSLEVFKAQRRSRPLRVYLLRYDDSPEMDRYQNSVVRERSAFENLIRAKGIMAPATVTGAPTAALAPVGAGNAQPEGNALTRRAGGRLAPQPERVKIIVDVREFMSPLPAVLHAQGFTVIPLTLEVGDYVLSPEICVERKSLPDLRGSLQSGRLYQQAEAMCRHYRTAILLIEFEGDRAFALQSPGELGDDIQSHSMMSRLVLLCLHHPRLRLVWSRSLHATADIFKRMKAHHEEPDPVAAATVGLDAESGAAVETLINTAAIDVLRRLPGVTDANYRALMREAGSLQRLATLPLARLTLVMGGEVAARKLHEFLQQECQALFKAL